MAFVINQDRAIDLTIPLQFDVVGPNAFYAPQPESSPVIAGDFIGDTTKGGVVNFKNLRLNPHGNGTHTECVGHISADRVSMSEVMKRFLFDGVLISVIPTKANNGDQIILANSLDWDAIKNREALIVRTLPNHTSKVRQVYSGSNPAYFDADVLNRIRDLGVLHFITDLPSVDREEDGGKLAAHKAFWNYPTTLDRTRTITEMVYIPDYAKDGRYTVMIQSLPIDLDVSPSRVVIFPVD